MTKPHNARRWREPTQTVNKDILADVLKMIEKLQADSRFSAPYDVILPWTGLCFHCQHPLTLIADNAWKCEYCDWTTEQVLIREENGCMVVRRLDDI